jgi:hypothetical protein
LDENSTTYQSTEQPRPSQKRPPKWLTKTLESVHPDEVGKFSGRFEETIVFIFYSGFKSPKDGS